MRQACLTRERIAAAPAPFQNITFPDCHIIQEPRVLMKGIRQAAALYIAYGPPLFLSRGSVEALETELPPFMPGDMRPLMDDTLTLARRYQRLSGTDEIRFRLEKIKDDSCRCFHVDNVPLRLLCAYAGPGVQWHHAGEEDVHETPTGYITLLKGRLYPGWSEEGSVRHRSPPLSTLNAPVTRLLLTLDHPDACGMRPR
ncbi:hypothetical protein AA0472_0299 [Acetobacter estunensis NRIC 0472]|uniref:DUF1826 domain-containing protein n=1 Tax=Acetobacter estunensis TaxID=104097 RepID=A0A967ED42_9PROT|nr:DUF1826 domain-containing protein [Acetobacter estunensis]NHO53605.1 DUF1826 domain-containing protein [Acetobacter estunensis]GBQ20957.1 hypothetical protein AA0472_0299 [Acetobacter estunensis NRIC 0472]